MPNPKDLYGAFPVLHHFRNKETWQFRRFCQDDWILNLRVHRTLGRNRFEVALFLAEDHELFVKGSGVLGGLVFSLSEAYHKTGTMRIHFVGPPVGFERQIPPSVRDAASELGVTLKKKSVITDGEGRRLYARITGLSANTVDRLTERGIDLVKACFTIHRGIWTKDQVTLRR